MTEERPWAVTAITDRRVVADGHVQYLVRWEAGARLPDSWVAEDDIRLHGFGAFIDEFESQQAPSQFATRPVVVDIVDTRARIDSAQTLLHSITSDDDGSISSSPPHSSSKKHKPPVEKQQQQQQQPQPSPPVNNGAETTLTVQTLFAHSNADIGCAMLQQLPPQERPSFLQYATRYFSRADLITLQKCMYPDGMTFFDEMAGWVRHEFDAARQADHPHPITFVQDVLILVDLLPLVDDGVDYTAAAKLVLQMAVQAQNKDVNIVARRILDNWAHHGQRFAEASAAASTSRTASPKHIETSSNVVMPASGSGSRQPSRQQGHSRPGRNGSGPRDAAALTPTAPSQLLPDSVPQFRQRSRSRSPGRQTSLDDRRNKRQFHSDADHHRGGQDRSRTGPPRKSMRLTEADRRELIERGACLYCRQDGHLKSDCKIRPASRFG
ncbi:Chromo domain-containing protein [Plasmodiophora brassicae]